MSVLMCMLFLYFFVETTDVVIVSIMMAVVIEPLTFLSLHFLTSPPQPPNQPYIPCHSCYK